MTSSSCIAVSSDYLSKEVSFVFFIRSIFFTDVEPVATVDNTWVFILVGGVTFCVVVIVIAITVYKEYPEWRGAFSFLFF